MQILNQAQTYCTEDDCQDPQGQVRNGAGISGYVFNSDILNKTTYLAGPCCV